MPAPAEPATSFASRLLEALGVRAREYASKRKFRFYESLGKRPTPLFQAEDPGRHGNFHPASYRAILSNNSWQLRLGKPHPQRADLPEEHRSQARELDSSNSSDALLMNVFCHPATAASPRIAGLLGLSRLPAAEFGFEPHVPLADGKGDETEIDLKLGADLFIEAKLTERDFGRKPLSSVERYRDFRTVFEGALLPRAGGDLLHFQLVRNILAAHAHRARFTLLCDARRPDLLRAFWETARAVKPLELRRGCGFVLWQEIAAAAPPDLAEFLRDKYGIR